MLLSRPLHKKKANKCQEAAFSRLNNNEEIQTKPFCGTFADTMLSLLPVLPRYYLSTYMTLWDLQDRLGRQTHAHAQDQCCLKFRLNKLHGMQKSRYAEWLVI